MLTSTSSPAMDDEPVTDIDPIQVGSNDVVGQLEVDLVRYQHNS